MDAVTYPDETVADFITDNLIALRLKYDTEPYASQFQVKWTPDIIILGPDGKAHQQSVGFMHAKDFIAFLELGMAKVDFDSDCFEDSLEHLENILSRFKDTPSAPEAVFLRGVNNYKKSGSPGPLKDAYEKLQADYPDNPWAKRASPYRLL